MLVNPKGRRKAKKGRTAAQKRATARMLAANRAKRAHNPSPRRRAKRRTAAAPIVYRRRARRHNPAHRVHYRRRRRSNPISMGHLKIGSLLKAGAIGAGGAIIVDAVMGYLPLPASVTAKTNADGSTNYLNAGTKLALSVVLGTLGRKLFKRAAPTMALGAVTVEMYNLIRPMLSSVVPGLGYYSPAFIPGQTMVPGAGLGAYTGAYVPAGFPAPVRLAQLGAYIGAQGPAIGASAAMNKERASYVR
jgi:hypothetical protein